MRHYVRVLSFILSIAIAQTGSLAKSASAKDVQKAQQLYEQGRKSKQHGLAEEARAEMTQASQLDPDGIGAKAQVFIRTALPKYPVSAEAQAANKQAYELMKTDPPKALPLFQDCIKKYPKFEWPYGNLALIYIQTGQTDKAKSVLHDVLQLNPDYLHAWIYLTQAHMVDKNYAEAKKCILTAKKLNPDHPKLDLMLQAVESQEGLDTKNKVKSK